MIDTPIANRPPVAVNDHETVGENTTTTFNIKGNDSDPDGDNLGTPTIIVGTVNGTIISVGSNGIVTYAPDSNLHSLNNQPVDSFEYVVCDTLSAHGPKPLCDTAEVYIYVTPMNLPPVANDIYLTTPENTPIGVNVASGAFDPNGDPLTYSYPNGTTTVQGGTIVITNNGAVNYYPPTGFIGVDSFKYMVCDSSPYNIHSLCDSAWVVITVTNPADTLVNHPPVASNDYGITAPGATITVNVKANDSDPDGNPINVTATSVTTTALGGTVVINPDGTINYTAPATIPASIVLDSFSYTLCDTNALHATHVLCTTAVVYITINRVDTNIIHINRPPVAADDFSIICANEYSIVNVVNNDIDPNGDPLAITAIVVNPTHGIAAVNGANVYYIPANGFFGQDSLEYRVCDNRTPAQCSMAWVHYTVRAISFPPRAVEDTTYTNMNTAVNIHVVSNDQVMDSNYISIAVNTPPSNGTLGRVGNMFVYTPDPGFAGYDTFYYRICNSRIPNVVYCDTFVPLCDVGLVSVHVLHHAPHIDSIYVTIPENSPLDTICPRITDVDGNSVKITSFVCGPRNGTASFANSGSDSCLTYIPNPNFVGQDTICVVVCDNVNPTHLCDTNQVFITVTRICIPPVANIDSYSVSYAQSSAAFKVLVNDHNYDTSALRLTVVTQPHCGSALVFANTVINYAPNTTVNCADSFTYSICNVGPACTLCDTATVYVNVAGGPFTPPVAVNDTTSTPENTPVCVHVTANDHQGTNPFTITSACSAHHGTDSIAANGFICYTPAHGFIGLDSFCYTICDNSVPALCSTATVYVNVTPNVHPPVAVNDTACTYQNTAVTVCVLNNDYDTSSSIAPATFTLVTLPANGTVTGVSAQGCVTFVPNSVVGIDSFTYRICDSTPVLYGDPLCASGKVYINVNPLNHQPVVSNTTFTVQEDSSAIVCPTLSDPDPGQTVSIQFVCTPQHGTAVQTNATCVNYTPDPLFFGSDSFCVIVCDNSTLPSCSNASTVLCDTSIIHINVTHVPHCPIANIDFAAGQDTIPVTINQLNNDYYVHTIGSPVSVTIVSGPAAGNTATVNTNGTITYTAGAGYHGVDTVVYQLTDSVEGCSSTAKIVIYTVDTCVGPILYVAHDSVCEGGAVSTDVLSTQFVGNTGVGSFSIVQGASHGLAVVNTLNNQIVYHPDANFFGFDTIKYQVCDRCTPANCTTGDLVMHVLYTNHTPVAVDDTVTILENHNDTINVLANDYTVDGVPLALSISAQPTHGRLRLWNNQLIYSPDQYYCGTDSFGYKITVEQPGSSLCSNQRPWALGLVFVNITCVNYPPIIPDTTVYIPEDTTPITICLPFIEHQAGQTDSITSICQPSHGTITSIGISNTTDQMCLTYQVDSNFHGVDSICVVICNNGTPVLCDTSHITIVVYPIIIAVNDTARTGCHTPVVVCVKNNDYSQDNTPFNVTGIATQPAHGTATIDSLTQCVTYNPDGSAAAFPGGFIDSFRYAIKGLRGATDSAWVFVKVACCSVHAVSDTFNVGYQDSIFAAVLRNDLYNDSFPQTITILAGSGPANGTATIVGDSVKYVANRGFCGLDVFKYVLTDLCGSDTALVQITVSCDSNCFKPVAVNDSVEHGYVCADTINVLANDTFTVGAVVSVIKAPLYGTDTVINNNIVYTPDGNHPNTLDSVVYSLCNPCGRCDTGTVYIQLSGYPCNVHHPIVVNDTLDICKNTDTLISVLANDYDLDGNTISLSGVYTQGTHGLVSQQGNQFLYHPNANYVGSDTFAYQACDNGIPSLCNTARVIIRINACTPPPIVVDTLIRDTTTACTGKTFCIDSIYQGPGYTLHFAGFCDSPSHGTAVLSTDTTTGVYGTLCFTYQAGTIPGHPDSCYVGNDTFCVVICNTGIDTVCTTTHVIITILPKPAVDSIWANTDVSYTCDRADTIHVLSNDGFLPKPGDPQTGTAISVIKVGAAAGLAPAGGTVVIGAGDSTVIYVPNPTFAGVDTFKYVIAKNGSLALYDTAMVIVYVCQPPHPIAVYDCSDTTTYVNVPVIISELTNDTLFPANDTTVTVIIKPEHGTAVVNANLTITFTPDSGFYGHDSMVYEVCETVGSSTACSRATICLNVIDTAARCFFPNGFSPNGDGINDVFAFPCNSNYPNATMVIFNRWGDVVWETANGYHNDWNGTNQQGTPVPDGTYYFIYKYNDGSGKSEARFVVVHR